MCERSTEKYKLQWWLLSHAISLQKNENISHFHYFMSSHHPHRDWPRNPNVLPISSSAPRTKSMHCCLSFSLSVIPSVHEYQIKFIFTRSSNTIILLSISLNRRVASYRRAVPLGHVVPSAAAACVVEMWTRCAGWCCLNRRINIGLPLEWDLASSSGFPYKSEKRGGGLSIRSNHHSNLVTIKYGNLFDMQKNG